jgi:hypothetical protein
MVATRTEVHEWIMRGRKQGARWIISVCDTHDYEDYPVYVAATGNLRALVSQYHGKNMQQINEIISLEPDGPTVEDLTPESFLQSQVTN